MERLYGKAMMRPYDLLPSTVWPVDNAVRYCKLARTIKRPYIIFPAMGKSYGHTATSYNLAWNMHSN